MEGREPELDWDRAEEGVGSLMRSKGYPFRGTMLSGVGTEQSVFWRLLKLVLGNVQNKSGKHARLWTWKVVRKAPDIS